MIGSPTMMEGTALLAHTYRAIDVYPRGKEMRNFFSASFRTRKVVH